MFHRNANTMKTLLLLQVLCLANSFIESAPQLAPEINDQFEESNHTEIEMTKNTEQYELNTVTDNNKSPTTTESRVQEIVEEHAQINDTALQIRATEIPLVSQSYFTKLYLSIKKPLIEFISTPKVNIVLKNVGTCIVNGAMEIISFYFPAPLIPLIASAAGMMIPFEPVVMLRKRMPVTSYRRAINSAVNSFMGTFDSYKESEEDPYMTRRFNRRFLAENSKEKD